MQKSDYKKTKRAEGSQEFEQYILDLARVTRVTEGGKQLSFRVCVLIGDRNGRVGYGVAKGKDVQLGVEKAVHQAKKRVLRVPITNGTIPHAVIQKFKAAKVLLKPAPRGSGIIAGGAVRSVLDLAGIPNISSKILGKTKNKIAVVKATFEALKSFKSNPRLVSVSENRLVSKEQTTPVEPVEDGATKKAVPKREIKKPREKKVKDVEVK